MRSSYILFGRSQDCGAICISSTVRKKLLPKGKLPHEVTRTISVEATCKELSAHVTKQIGITGRQNNSDGCIIAYLPLEKFDEIYEKIANSLGDFAGFEEYEGIPDCAIKKEIVDLSNLPLGINWVLLSKKSAPIIIPAEEL